MTGPNRRSRTALVTSRQWSAPGLEQALELAAGVLPREYESWDEVKGQSAKLLPTPSASTPNDGEDPAQWQERHDRHASKDVGATRSGLPLSVAAARLLPTPTAGDGKSSGSRRLEGSQAHAGMSLTDAVVYGNDSTPRRLLPTPSAADAARGPDYARMNREDSGGDDLLTLIARLTGDRMRPPSNDGNTPLDAELPLPSTSDDD